jgi:hypothetical protein
LQRLQAAQDALSAARKDIQRLDTQVANLQQETMQVGDIVVSVLSETDFNRQRKNNYWVLADGRDVTGSKYASITHQSRVPDLRAKIIYGQAKRVVVTPMVT